MDCAGIYRFSRPAPQIRPLFALTVCAMGWAWLILRARHIQLGKRPVPPVVLALRSALKRLQKRVNEFGVRESIPIWCATQNKTANSYVIATLPKALSAD